ncbi:MAG TPA: alpha/beta hydrolase [Candidatus Ozemobacteraceae bacterium]|nr:alpha/beta hydrolase [Candidatus Ozemobacteraceae bacterium]
MNLLKTLFKLVLFLGIALYLLQDHIIFFPVRLPALPELPTVAGRRFEHVAFTTADGVRLTGILMETASGPAAPAAPASLPVLLFSHGNAGNLADRLPRLIEAFAPLPVDVFLYDYRGFGHSEGRPSISGVKADAVAALEYLHTTRGIPLPRIILYGESIGGGVAAWLAGLHPAEIGGLVIESGFRSLKNRAGSRFPVIGPLVLSDDLPSDRILSTYDGPLLIIHSRDDRIIPFEDGKALFDLCPSPRKSLCELRGAGHNDPVWRLPEYLPAWQGFLASHLPPLR